FCPVEQRRLLGARLARRPPERSGSFGAPRAKAWGTAGAKPLDKERMGMAARPTWKGFMKISLVNIPVRVFPATDSAATISFNQLHAECQTRIQQKRWCPNCQREVPISEVVKGYEFEKGRYVVMTEEDVSKVRPESTRVIDLVQFTDAVSIDPIYFERPYYLAPDGAMATEAFAVMREG